MGRLGWPNPGFAYEDGVVRGMLGGEPSNSGLLALSQGVVTAGWLHP